MSDIWQSNILTYVFNFEFIEKQKTFNFLQNGWRCATDKFYKIRLTVQL